MTASFPSRFPEERRLATVLFADIMDFTSMAEKMDFEKVTDLIKEVWLRLDQVIVDHNGYIDKHIGDAVMAVWGAPYGAEDDAERAVMAALALPESLRNYAQETRRQPQESLQIRVAVHTGPVLSGYVGLRAEYTVMGDTVNLANRLQAFAEPGTILISDATYRVVRGLFRVRRMEPVQLKGKSAPVQAYLVEDRLNQPNRMRYRNAGGMQTRMVARDGEVQRLMNLFRETRSGHNPNLILVVGEAGLGKSRLLMEFTNRLEGEEPGLTLISGRGLAQTEKVPFYLWKSLWHNRFGISEDLDPETVRTKSLQGIRELWGRQLGAASAVEAAHLIGDLIDVQWPGSPFLDILKDSPILRAHRAFELTRELFARVAANTPTLLVFDDLQWADKRSLDLLAYLLEPSPVPLPMMILGAARPDLFRKQIRWANTAQTIALTPLPFDAALVKEAYPDFQDISEKVLEQLARRADGNPYFLEEMVKSLQQARLDAGSPTNTGPLTELHAHLPNTLQTMLQARIDSLSREARAIALLASVVGRVFWVGAVVAASRQPTSTGILNLPVPVIERMVQNALRELIEAELAFPRAGSVFAGEQEYIFKHSILRDVAYSLLPHKYRRLYHHAVAKWLSGRAGPDFQVMVAEHFELGGDIHAAIRHYQQAAKYAHSRGAKDEVQWLLGKIDFLVKGRVPA